MIPGLPGDHPGLLTPSLKLKRDEVLRLVAAEVERIYAAPPRQAARGPA